MVLVLGIVKASLEILGIGIGVKNVVLLRSGLQNKTRKSAKNSRNYTQNLLDFGKKLKHLKKTQGYEAMLGLLGLQKVHKK